MWLDYGAPAATRQKRRAATCGAERVRQWTCVCARERVAEGVEHTRTHLMDALGVKVLSSVPRKLARDCKTRGKLCTWVACEWVVWFESFPLWFESFANYTRTPAEQCGARFRARTCGRENCVVQGQGQGQPVRTSSVLSF